MVNIWLISVGLPSSPEYQPTSECLTCDCMGLKSQESRMCADHENCEAARVAITIVHVM